MQVPIKDAGLEKVTYKIMSGETEIAVGWVVESDGFIAIYQISTGEYLIGEPEQVHESQVQARTPLYDITNVEEALRNKLWKKPYLERFSGVGAMDLFQKEYGCSLPDELDSSGEYHKNPAIERVRLWRQDAAIAACQIKKIEEEADLVDRIQADEDAPEGRIFKGIIRRGRK